MPTTLKRDSLLSFANSHREEFETLLKRFVETPTVSVDPNHADDIRKGVELTAETLEGYGGKVEIYRAEKGNPVIHGVFGNDNNLPTVTVYNHIDVQPASKETEPWDTEPFEFTQKASVSHGAVIFEAELWDAEPFEFTQKGDTYYGRGTTDDKG